MAFPRAVIKLIAFWLWAFFMLAAWQVCAVWLTGRRYWRWHGWMFCAWARGARRVLGMRTQVYGTPPPAPFLLVSNHLSYVDILALLTRTNCTFVAKSEVARWPVVGAIGRRIGIIFLDRNRKRDLPRTLGVMENALAHGVSVVFFPEGTSTSGDVVETFKPSLLAMAAQHERPVYYAALHYSTPPEAPPARDNVCWWGDMTFPAHFLNLLKLRSFQSHLAFGAQPVRAADRKELAEQLWVAVSAQHAGLKRSAHSDTTPGATFFTEVAGEI